MEDTQLRTQSTHPRTLIRRGVDWSAIWGGVFVFAAIWSVFETLAIAIFGGRGVLSNPQSTMAIGLAIWTVVLTLIAMYVAGRETGRLASVATRHNSLIHGMMMFGLSVVGAFVLAILAGAIPAPVRSGYAASAGMEWTAFFTLLLGWLAAMGGASTGTKQDLVRSRQPDQVRPAA